MLDRLAPCRRRTLEVGGLEISAAGLAETAADIVAHCTARARDDEPLVMTSINGQVLSLCAADRRIRELFGSADAIHCDGQPLVLLSRLIGACPLPERVATTDLYPVLGRLAAEHGLTFYLHGASEEVNREAVARSLAAYPGLRIVGASHGYLSPAEEERVLAEIARLKPDVLWVALGVPREQAFAVRNRAALKGVGVIKTSGGLFDFLALRQRRAPRWMQRAGLEWLFRLAQEPRRLFLRYLVTSPHALVVMVRTIR